MLNEILLYISAYIGLFGVTFYILGFFMSKKTKTLDLKDEDLPSVSIIIPAYNEERGVVETIKSAERIDYPSEKIELIVVDDGSKDNTYSLAKSVNFKNLRVFKTARNMGKAAALNFGIEKSKGEIIISMDADTVVNPDAVRKMVSYFYSDDVVCVTPGMLIKDPKGILQRIQQIEYVFGIFLRKAFGNLNTIHITPGAFSAYRKSFFEKYGGYKEGNMSEDLEVALRIQFNNLVIENCPEAVIHTGCPRTFSALLKQRRRWYHGQIWNILDYKKLFSRKYGDLGMVVLPLAVITPVLAIAVTSYVTIRSLINIAKEISWLSSINFNFASTISLNRYLLENTIFTIFTNPVILLSILFVLIVTMYIVFAKIRAKDESRLFWGFVLFMSLYYILNAFWWSLSIIYFLMNKKVTWGK